MPSDQRPPGTVLTFYSYKGGVGRTFLMANAAVWLARAGFRVLCVDWDLEAPGLVHYFAERRLISRATRLGLVDLLLALQAQQSLAWRSLVRPTSLPPASGGPPVGALHLIDAGDVFGGGYGEKLARLSLRESYESDDIALGYQLEAVRSEWADEYDVVLIDSRTGLTDSGGICTAQLPDLIVAVFAPNLQGFDGALRALDTAQRQRSNLPVGRGRFLALPVLSRFDPQAAGDALEKWQRIAAERLEPLYAPWRDKHANAQTLATLLRVPYVPRWSLGEPLPILDENVDDPTTVSFAIATIAAFCARRFEGSAELVKDRGSYVRAVIERGPALLGRGAAEAAATAARTFQYDVFLSFGADTRDRARQVAAELKDRGRSVLFDERETSAGQKWAQNLAEGLKHAQHLVVLTGTVPRPWQRAEVEAFLAEMRGSPDRRIVPVLLEGRPDWPELFAHQAVSGARRSPAQIASDVHRALMPREAGGGGASKAAAPPAPRLWTANEALAAYREWLLKEHNRLVPYFRGASEILLDDICVELALAPREGRDGEVQSELFGKAGGHEPRQLASLLRAEGSSPAPRCLVAGVPGAGKTTLARSLAFRRARDEGAVTLFVPLVRIGTERLDPVAFAVADMLGDAVAATPRGRVLAAALTAALAKGDVVVLLDGLDEVVPERIDTLFDEVVAFAASDAARRAPLAVLTRPIAVERRDVPETFVRATIRPLAKPQQDELLGKLLGERESERVRSHLDQRPALAELAESPLLLTLLAVVARDTVLAEVPLPATLAQLYETAVELFLRRGFGAEKKGVKDRVPARRVLQLLSFRLHAQGGEAWAYKELSEQLSALRREHDEANFLVKETWSSNDAFLDDVGRNAGILGPQDGENAPWRYLHRSLREFLAAEELATWPEERVQQHVEAWAKAEAQEREQRAERLRKAVAEPNGVDGRPRASRWGEVYAMLCSRAELSERVLKTIRAASPELMLRTLSQIDWLDGAFGLEFALDTERWDAELLLRLVRNWLVPADVAEGVLWARVGPGADADQLGQYWWLLEQVGRRPEREKFFAQCGRPVGGAPRLAAVEVPAGTFVMGSPPDEPERYTEEGPQREVAVARFWLCATTVTNADYRRFEPRHSGDNGHPATEVSWWAAFLFCRWLGDDVRLPGEAEWEYACRAGTTTPFSFGKNVTPEQVNYDGNYPYAGGNKGVYRQRTVPVGSLSANPWGLYEMHGNVWEWCQDRAHWGYEGAPSDGNAWEEESGSSFRVLRGGSWFNGSWACRSAFRIFYAPSIRNSRVGFRPASSSPDSFVTPPPGPRVQTEARTPVPKSATNKAPRARRRTT